MRDPDIGRRIVAESLRGQAGDDPRDVLTEWERDLVGPTSIDLRIPLRDPMMLRRHLALAEETFRAIRLRMERRGMDRSDLLMARLALRILHKKLNAYRAPRKE